MSFTLLIFTVYMSFTLLIFTVYMSFTLLIFTVYMSFTLLILTVYMSFTLLIFTVYVSFTLLVCLSVDLDSESPVNNHLYILTGYTKCTGGLLTEALMNIMSSDTLTLFCLEINTCLIRHFAMIGFCLFYNRNEQ